jgi:hypothetical protein
VPPIRSVNLDDGIAVTFSDGAQFVESKLNIQGRLAGVSGNLKKKEDKFNEWLQLQPRWASIYPLSSYDADHPVRQDPPVLNVWQWIDGTNVVNVNCWVAVHLFNDAPLEFILCCRNKEVGPITGEWW